MERETLVWGVSVLTLIKSFSTEHIVRVNQTTIESDLWCQNLGCQFPSAPAESSRDDG